VSELTSLLADELPPGVYPWESDANEEDVRLEVEEAGWTFVHLSTADVTDKAGLLDGAAAAFGFAGWFGRNWDAFRDSLGDVRAERGTLVLWDGWDELARSDEEAFAIALELVRERAEGSDGSPLAVLLRESPGEG
jgi:hypothetical protein